MIRCRASVIIVPLLLAACTHGHRPPPAGTAPTRNPLRAEECTQTALPFLETDPERAERLLREALEADLFHGPAHNNLGVLHLSRGELYEAASEFEWARRLMPGHPDPRLNLAITLERAGRVDEAIDEYRSALEVYPGHIQSIQALARCRLRHRSEAHDAELTTHLREIALRGENEDWRQWARTRLATNARH